MKAAVLLLALAVAAQANVLQEASPLTGWSLVGRTNPNKRIRVILSMKKDMRRVFKHTMTVSEPGSSSFRQWATMDQSLAMRAAADTAATVAFFKSHGLEAHVHTDSVVVDMVASQAEKVFGTVLNDYRSERSGKVWHRASHLHAPKEVTDSVAAVFGLHGMPLPPKKTRIISKERRNASQGVIVAVGPTDLSKTYGVSGRGSGSTKVRQAVAEFQGQFANTNDLTTFFQQYVPNAQPGDDQIYAYQGNQESGDGVEALLDIEYIMGMAPGVKTEFWGWANFDFCTDLKNWTSTILGQSGPPLVFSISYGWQGDLSELGCDQGEIQDIDNDFATIAGRGLSIIFASGDSGSGWDGTSTLWPSWPASSPWVTAVGATAFTDQTMSTQQASDQFGSGSGFSAMFPVGSWQRSAVSAYLRSQSANLPPSSYWSRGGRATADISALGEGYNVVIDGSTEQVGGTSASTPMFAALISLLNDQLVGSGQQPMGFLNPWIYNNTNAFTDITLGTDAINRDGTTAPYGFAAAPGWDPPTGWGVPNYPIMNQQKSGKVRRN